MTKSLLFVVVVKYNSETLSWLRNLIIVDNNKVNRGFSKAVNIGIKKALARGANKILLLNPDIIISPEQISILAKTPGDIISPVLVSNGKKDFGGKINWIFGRTTHLQGDPLRGKESPYDIDYVSGACMLIKREVFEKIGLFDERFFMYYEDADFCLRAKLAGFKIALNPNIIVSHELTKNKQKYSYNLQSNFKFINKWIAMPFRPLSYIYLLFLWLRTR